MSELIAQGYGQILAQAREAKGLTVAQVADKLKLTSRQIEALEAEDASRLPATVFVRGFIRNYARLVDVPLESLPVVAEAPTNPTETITAHSEELRFHASPVRRWLLLPMAVFGLFMILVALLYTWLRQGEEAYVPAAPAVSSQPLPAPVAVPAPTEPIPAATAPAGAGPTEPAPAAQPAVPAGALPSSAPPAVLPPASPVPSATPGAVQPVAVPQPAAPAKPAVTARPAAPAVAQPVAAAPAPAPAAPAPSAVPAYSSPFSIFSRPVAQAPTPAPAPARSIHTMQLVAESTDSWIEVVSGDDKHYSRLLRSGEQLTLRGAAPFRLVVGNAAGVRLSYDSRAIDLRPYTGDKVARLTLE